jgi:hypothetical protein
VSFGQTIDGTDVDVIQGSTPAGMIGTIYVDKKTGLVRRYIRYANTMVGRIPTQVEFTDYRDVNGVKMPFKYSYAWVSERDDWTMTGYDINPAIDNAKFGRPDPKTAGDVAGGPRNSQYLSTQRRFCRSMMRAFSTRPSCDCAARSVEGHRRVLRGDHRPAVHRALPDAMTRMRRSSTRRRTT